MALDPRKRQKKLMKQRQKANARKKALTHAAKPYAERSPVEKIRVARGYPIIDCRINANWQTTGMANILIARRQPDSLICFGVFLVDVLCLGVKSSFCNADFTQAEYEDRVRNRSVPGEPADISPELAHAIIYGGIDFAAKFGFGPDADFATAQFVLDPRDAFASLPLVEFGRDGKPSFVAGPDDNVPAILRKLEKTAGPNNFDYMINAFDSPTSIPVGAIDFYDGETEFDGEDEDDEDNQDHEEEQDDGASGPFGPPAG